MIPVHENIEAPIPWFAGGIALEPHSMSALLSGILGDDLSWEPDPTLTRPEGPTWPDPTIKKGAEPEGPTPVGTLDLLRPLPRF